MATGDHANTARPVRATRSAGVLSLVVGVLSAAALTGAAVFTVDRAGCAAPAQYIRHDNHIELVGGCVNGEELPPAPHAPSGSASGADAQPGNYRP
ncbi:hypothetical protein [Amycolatopsis sp. NPDC058986]|uniref:hypothetical protein n=1 Tax=unclassified Amycolatopsis TaxID=2618356 RepID=UPI00366FC004